jgi:hypothetical protein
MANGETGDQGIGNPGTSNRGKADRGTSHAEDASRAGVRSIIRSGPHRGRLVFDPARRWTPPPSRKVERIVTCVFYRITTWKEYQDRLEKFGTGLGLPPEFGTGWEPAIIYKGMVEAYIEASPFPFASIPYRFNRFRQPETEIVEVKYVNYYRYSSDVAINLKPPSVEKARQLIKKPQVIRLKDLEVFSD